MLGANNKAYTIQSRKKRHHLIICHRIKFSVSHFPTAADAIHDEIIVPVHDFLTFMFFFYLSFSPSWVRYFSQQSHSCCESVNLKFP